MDIQKFEGNYFQIGQQKGEIYVGNRKSYKHIKINKNIFVRQLNLYKKFYPELLEELKGISKSVGFDKNKVIYSGIMGETEWLNNRTCGCSIFGIKKDDNLFIGRNYDWYFNAKKSFKIFKVIHPTFKYISLSDMWVPKFHRKSDWEYHGEDYINNFGLYIGLTFAYGSKYSYGINSNHMIRMVAEKCSNIEEAINLFKKVPQSDPKNFFIADKNGGMVVIEHNSGKDFKLIYPENNLLIKTNHYLNKNLSKIDKVLEKKPLSDTFIRYWELQMLLNKYKDNFKFSDIKKIMIKENKYIFSQRNTIWSLFLDVMNGKYKFCCENNDFEIKDF